MPDQRLELHPATFGPRIGSVVREARQLVGWSQDELAARARTSQATVWRIESASGSHLDLLVVERVLAALGIRAALDLDARHLADRRRQADGVHARLNGATVRWLERLGWLTATEVPIGDGMPRGWIDLLAFRQADRSLLVEETKTEVLDLGGLQRSVAFYAREARGVARQLGWDARRVATLVVVLDTAAVASRIVDARDAFNAAFPALVSETTAWLRDPACPPPTAWTLAVADPASRAQEWLRPSAASSRRQARYLDYRDAAGRLLRT